MRSALAAGLVVLMASALPATTSATVVTFDGPSEQAFPGGTITRQGFHFALNNPPGGASFIEVGQPRDLGGLFNANGARFDMTRAGGGVFDLVTFDLARRQNDTSYTRSASSLTVVGQLFGGGSVSFATGPLTLAFQQIVLPTSFANLVSVGFNPAVNANGGSANYEFLVDNIDTMAAPEPMTAAMAMAGILLACSRRRRASA